MLSEALREKLDTLPTQSGVYVMKDRDFINSLIDRGMTER